MTTTTGPTLKTLSVARQVQEQTEGSRDTDWATIVRQVGGLTLGSIGAREVVSLRTTEGSDRGVLFKALRSLRWVQIRVNGWDLYDVIVWTQNPRTGEARAIARRTDVYCDDLGVTLHDIAAEVSR